MNRPSSVLPARRTPISVNRPHDVFGSAIPVPRPRSQPSRLSAQADITDTCAHPAALTPVAFMTTPVMVVYTVRGLTSVNSEARELMASIESTPGQIYRLVQIPTALPYIFTALKSMVVLALIGVIVTEAMRGFEGLGFVIADAMSGFEAATAWLALVAIAVMGIVSYLIVGLVERLVVPWDTASRASG